MTSFKAYANALKESTFNQRIRLKNNSFMHSTFDFCFVRIYLNQFLQMSALIQR